MRAIKFESEIFVPDPNNLNNLYQPHGRKKDGLKLPKNIRRINFEFKIEYERNWLKIASWHS